MHGQVSAAFDQDQQTQLYIHLASLELADQRAFADDIDLLENDSTRTQWQLDKLEHEANKVGLEINVQKTEQMRLNQSSNLSPTDPLKGPTHQHSRRL